MISVINRVYEGTRQVETRRAITLHAVSAMHPSQSERVLALVDWLEEITGAIPEDIQREVDAEYCAD